RSTSSAGARFRCPRAGGAPERAPRFPVRRPRRRSIGRDRSTGEGEGHIGGLGGERLSAALSRAALPVLVLLVLARLGGRRAFGRRDDLVGLGQVEELEAFEGEDEGASRAKILHGSSPQG